LARHRTSSKLRTLAPFLDPIGQLARTAQLDVEHAVRVIGDRGSEHAHDRAHRDVGIHSGHDPLDVRAAAGALGELAPLREAALPQLAVVDAEALGARQRGDDHDAGGSHHDTVAEDHVALWPQAPEQPTGAPLAERAGVDRGDREREGHASDPTENPATCP
jgi:hypothetical protein